MNEIVSITEIQKAIADKLNENTTFAEKGVEILIENSKDIRFEIESAIKKLGIVATVTTPTLRYGGNYATTGDTDLPAVPYWEISEMSVVVVETPQINRGRADYITALDAGLQISQTLMDIPSIGLGTISQTEQNGFIVVTVSFNTNIIFKYNKEYK